MVKTTFPLSFIISLRFLSLFLVLPVLSVYALNFDKSNPTLVGIAIGGYALTQMIFQVPFGVLSDKIGRRVVIIIGLLIFALGSYIAFISTDIYTLMLGRFLQGAGAIGSVVSAMISDFVKEEKRSSAMAIMGASISIAFAIAMIGGPFLAAHFGVKNLFLISLILPLSSIIILLIFVPKSPKITHTYNEKVKIKEVLFNTNLIRMNITNFLQKALITFAFVIIPLVLVNDYKWEVENLWKVYAPSMIFGLIAMAPAAILAEKKGKFKEVLLAGIILFALSYLVLGFSSSSLFFNLGVILFFIGFNMHEPIMQSLASKFAKVHQRGLVLGIFNSFGYLGSFLGGLLGGISINKISLSFLVLIIALICIFWIILLVTMQNPSHKKIIYLSFDKQIFKNTSNLNIPSIDEWYINNSERILAIKYNEKEISKKDIIKLLQ